MRVTNHMMKTTILNNLMDNLQSLQKTQDQMSSGLVVSRPSDDPVVTGRIMSLKATLAAQSTYAGNIQDGQNILNTADGALANFSDILKRVRELMVYGASGTLSAGDRAAIGDEVDQLIDQLVEIGNSTCGSQYIFGGCRTQQPPLSRSGDVVTYSGDNGKIHYQIAQGVTMPVNLDGAELFQTLADPPVGLGNCDIFNTLIEVKNDLKNNTNISDLGGTLLGKIDGIEDHVLALRSVVGARSNRLDAALTRNDNDQTEITKVLSGLEDVDYAKIAVEYSERSYTYQAALATAAKVLPLSLVDYLK